MEKNLHFVSMAKPVAMWTAVGFFSGALGRIALGNLNSNSLFTGASKYSVLLSGLANGGVWMFASLWVVQNRQKREALNKRARLANENADTIIGLSQSQEGIAAQCRELNETLLAKLGELNGYLKQQNPNYEDASNDRLIQMICAENETDAEIHSFSLGDLYGNLAENKEAQERAANQAEQIIRAVDNIIHSGVNLRKEIKFG